MTFSSEISKIRDYLLRNGPQLLPSFDDDSSQKVFEEVFELESDATINYHYRLVHLQKTEEKCFEVEVGDSLSLTDYLVKIKKNDTYPFLTGISRENLEEAFVHYAFRTNGITIWGDRVYFNRQQRALPTTHDYKVIMERCKLKLDVKDISSTNPILFASGRVRKKGLYLELDQNKLIIPLQGKYKHAKIISQKLAAAFLLDKLRSSEWQEKVSKNGGKLRDLLYHFNKDNSPAQINALRLDDSEGLMKFIKECCSAYVKLSTTDDKYFVSIERNEEWEHLCKAVVKEANITKEDLRRAEEIERVRANEAKEQSKKNIEQSKTSKLSSSQNKIRTTEEENNTWSTVSGRSRNNRSGDSSSTKPFQQKCNNGRRKNGPAHLPKQGKVTAVRNPNYNQRRWQANNNVQRSRPNFRDGKMNNGKKNANNRTFQNERKKAAALTPSRKVTHTPSKTQAGASEPLPVFPDWKPSSANVVNTKQTTRLSTVSDRSKTVYAQTSAVVANIPNPLPLQTYGEIPRQSNQAHFYPIASCQETTTLNVLDWQRHWLHEKIPNHAATSADHQHSYLPFAVLPVTKTDRKIDKISSRILRRNSLSVKRNVVFTQKQHDSSSDNSVGEIPINDYNKSNKSKENSAGESSYLPQPTPSEIGIPSNRESFLHMSNQTSGTFSSASNTTPSSINLSRNKESSHGGPAPHTSSQSLSSVNPEKVTEETKRNLIQNVLNESGRPRIHINMCFQHCQLKSRKQFKSVKDLIEACDVKDGCWVESDSNFSRKAG